MKRTIEEINKSEEKTSNVFSTPALMIQEEIDFLKKTLKEYKDKIVIAVELGCYRGGTSQIIIEELYKNATLYCVDSFVIDGSKVRGLFIDRVLPQYPNMKLMEMTTHQASQEFKQPIDFLLVDADHQRHSIKEDCEDWLSKVKSGAIVAFHDYRHPHFPTVAEEVDQATKGWKTLGIEGHLAIRIKP